MAIVSEYIFNIILKLSVKTSLHVSSTASAASSVGRYTSPYHEHSESVGREQGKDIRASQCLYY